MIKAFKVRGRVEKVFVAAQFGTHESTEVEKIKFIKGHGIKGDNHAGSRLLDVRDSAALRFGLPKGMEVANTREWSAISQEEMKEVEKLMGVEGIHGGLIGENLLISGMPKFTKLPIGTQFFFESPQGEKRSTILFSCGENKPCSTAGKSVQDQWSSPENLSTLFVKHANYRRGLVGFVFSSGFVKKGDIIVAEVPKQELYDVGPAE